MSTPNTLQDIRDKIRRITARPSTAQISDTEIDKYINTAYLYDFPEHLRLENLRVNYQFITNAYQPVYDFPTDLYLTVMPPVFIDGYQSYMTQSRENAFRIYPQLSNVVNVATGIGAPASYTFTLSNTPILPGFKRNPPGAYANVFGQDPATWNWNVMFSFTSSTGVTQSLVDDGLGNLFALSDNPTLDPSILGNPNRGNINYITGQTTLTFPVVVPAGAAINAHYFSYKPSRPQTVCFFQDQIEMFPVPDQAYTVSFECYKYPTAFLSTQPTSSPQVKEWWQLLAYLAADKIFTDNADFDNAQKFRVLLDEQMRLCNRRTIVQQSSERTPTMYSTQQIGVGVYPFGSPFSY